MAQCANAKNKGQSAIATKAQQGYLLKGTGAGDIPMQTSWALS